MTLKASAARRTSIGPPTSSGAASRSCAKAVAADATVIVELYRNGGGYSSDELSAFHDLVRTSPGNSTLTSLASRAAAQGYNRPNAAQRCAYLRVSQKEPFDILDFTPSVTPISNTADHRWSLTPEVLCTGIRNVELRARLYF
jgi:hypothetical protein